MDEEDKLRTRETGSKGFWAKVRFFRWLKSSFTRIAESDERGGDANEFREEIRSIGQHTIAAALILFSIWLIDYLLKHLLGEDAKLFDWIKFRYIFQLADVFVIVNYLWSVVRKIRRKR